MSAFTLAAPFGGPLRIRSDQGGDGAFLSGRTSPDAAGKPVHRPHLGLDLAGVPGETVLSPVNGLIIRWGWPYADDRKYRLVELLHDGWHVELYYLAPSRPTGAYLPAGDRIGVLQDVGVRYSNGTGPHLHVQVWRRPEYAADLDGVRTINMRGKLWYDPAPLLNLGGAE